MNKRNTATFIPLSLNEIRARALAFAKEWQSDNSERAEAQTFWNQFFHVFGVDRRRFVAFEQQARRFSGSARGRIDVFWPGVMLGEHKSAGRDLDAAFQQATDYFAGLSDKELPDHVVVSDFRRFRLYDIKNAAEPVEFALADLHKEIGRFGFISGYQTRTYKEEDPVNVLAAERMGKLYDALKASGYDGHALEVLLVRLLFCLFADDTGIFGRHAFHELIEQRTSEDGSDLGGWLARVFQTLNTPEEKRQKTLDEQLAQFRYVNGRLFEEMLPLADFDATMRNLLLDASTLDWSRISPAIFGSMFQSVMDAKARRNLGAHYTSEKNILKLIGPLFLDELKAELAKAGNDARKLTHLHRKLASLKFLDPACGCGNFLVIAYRELRLLELEIIKRQFAHQQSVLAHVQDHVLVDVDQFFGIEIEEFPAQIAQVAMWLMDHQMNQCVAEQFGENVVRLPLKKSATIVHDNALRLDWNDVVPATELGYIFGNPPFGGKHYQSKEQRLDQALVTKGIKSGSDLDFVANWFIKAAKFIAGTSIQAAFVATNSITQGEQVPLLWRHMIEAQQMHISFAHRAFRWNNEARGIAAVHCVIIGFSRRPAETPRLFDYEHPGGEPREVLAKNINPYLVEGPNLVVTKRSTPLMPVPVMRYGNKPADDGQFILSPEERAELIVREPAAEPWIKRYVGSHDFISGLERWCLWLAGIQPSQLRKMPLVLKRVDAIHRFRSASTAEPTRKAAERATEFFYISQPDTPYVVVPEVSSERRRYIPMGFLPADVICSNTNYLVPDAGIFTFGVLTSAMHMAWTGAVCGRLESRYRYSGSIVYNNFPWPEAVDDKHRTAVEAAAQSVLDARAQFPDSTLADLYDPLTMPPVLVKAHQQLDKAVDAAYLAAEKAAGRKVPKLGTDAERVAFLFERYQHLTSLLPTARPKRHRKTQ